MDDRANPVALAPRDALRVVVVDDGVGVVALGRREEEIGEHAAILPVCGPPHAALSGDVPSIAAPRSYDAGMQGMRVVLAEDSVLLRQGLVALLSEHPAVAEVIEAGDLGELLSAVSEQEPDVVLADIRMPPTHTDEGIRAAERFRRTHPKLGVVVLSQHADAEGALALVAGGSTGRGYLLKERVSDVEHLVSALEAVRRGESVIDPHVVDALMRHRLRFESSPVARLTSRERRCSV